MDRQGQTTKELIAMLVELEPHDLIFTEYKMVALTDGGGQIEVGYDVKDDHRFNGKPQA